MSAQEDRPAGDVSAWGMPGSFSVDGVTYPPHPFTPEAIGKIRSGDVPEHDVLVATFPRSGSAKLVEICWLLLHGCDIDKARSTPAIDRHLFLEMMCVPIHENPVQPPVVAKTHVDFETGRKLVESGKKIIVGIRNPKDVLVSYYHFNRMTVGHGLFPGNWGQFMEFYKEGKFPYGDHVDHVLSWWAQKDRDNIMVVTYEDLNENPLDRIRDISRFLGQEHTEADLQAVVQWVSFTNIKEQPAANYTTGVWERVFDAGRGTYMRKGTPGDWKNYFRDEDNDYIDHRCDTRAAPVGLTFQFD